jgi:hypothetical protein
MGKIAGSWLGEAFLVICPFTPLVEHSSRSTFTAHVINKRKLIFSPYGQGYGSPFLASYCGQSMGADILQQYGYSGLNGLNHHTLFRTSHCYLY